MILGITGHRPDKLPDVAAVRRAIVAELGMLQPTRLITGMAVGVDQIAAEVAIRLSVPFVAAVPFAGQEKLWPPRVQEHYRELLTKAADVVTVSSGGFSVQAMYDRNRWIVANSDHLLAVWDGTSGGTSHCVNYAMKCGWRIGERITVLDPRLL